MTVPHSGEYEQAQSELDRILTSFLKEDLMLGEYREMGVDLGGGRKRNRRKNMTKMHVKLSKKQ